MKGLVLLIISLVFTSFFSILWIPCSVVYHIVTLKWRSGMKHLDKYFYQLATIVDVFANESLETMFNHIMVKRQQKYFPFGGNDRDTISYVFGVNQAKGTETRLARFWGLKFLNTIDKKHLSKAITNKELRYNKYFKTPKYERYTSLIDRLSEIEK